MQNRNSYTPNFTTSPTIINFLKNFRMKKNLLLFLSIAFSVISYAQTYPVQDVDDCAFLNTLFGTGNGTYTASKTNPVGADASTNVSSIDPANPGGTFVGQRFLLPEGIETTETLDFIMRYYSATSTSNFEIRLQNETVGDATFLAIVSSAKTAGSWQTINLSGVSLSTGDGTTDADVNSNGGWNVLRIYSEFNVTDFADRGEFFFDNIQMNINPFLADDNADLESGNVWIHNNRDGDNQITPSSAFNGTVSQNIATPSTNGNSATTALRFEKTGSFSVLRFDIPPISPPFSGIVKFRVYFDACAPSVTNRMQVRLQTAASSNATGENITITDKKWEEITVDLSTLTGATSTNYTRFEIIVDNGAASSNNYFFDAIQGPFGGATTTYTGVTGGSWTSASNWSNGVPSEIVNATIPDNIDVSIFGSVKAGVNNLTMGGTSRLTLQGFDTELKIRGTATEGSGGVRYRRLTDDTAPVAEGYIGKDDWYLVSIPAGGGTVSDFDLAVSTSPGNESNRGAASYTTSGDAWVYKQVGVAFNVTNGTGFSLKRDAASAQGGFNFDGLTFNDADVSAPVVVGGTNGFNLLGNPFLASIKSASFLTANTDDLTSQTIWLWNGSSYETKVTADNFIIAPTQGFFVSANKATNLTFAKSSQTVGGTFQKGNGGKSEIRLNMTDGAANRFAKLYYFDNNVTTGFDNGYDGETFGGQPDAVDVFTHLVTDSQGKNY